ncbi:glycosyltransferase [Mongoliimonas terrestris]|uniref:glycosyltransferase n=1 Tax=Mongoliimonas terrestris TaxID=1709001 RepID=UPI00094980F3|nr:glycosyltransferase [Mongoliimonas terrestris]
MHRLSVLIPSDEAVFVDGLADAYRDLGHLVATGRDRLFDNGARFDLVHLQWPEEFSGWFPPKPDDTARVLDRLALLGRRARVIGEMHDLVPNIDGANPAYRPLVTGFYAACETVGHCSEHSRRSTLALYPELSSLRHRVHPPFSYRNSFVPTRVPPPPAGRPLRVGFFGSIREVAEFRLLVAAFKRFRRDGAELHVMGRLATSNRLGRALLRRWARWGGGVTLHEGHFSDDALTDFIDDLDVVLIPRRPPHNNSGVFYLAMQRGKMVVAPRYGIYEEFLAGTDNPLYAPGDARSAAEALATAAAHQPREVGRANRAQAAGWTFARILEAYGIHAAHRQSGTGG